MTDQPLRKAMGRPDATRRMVQWAVELSQFNVDYRPRTAIKAQALIDFVAEFTTAEQGLGSEHWTIHTDESAALGIGRVGVIISSPENDVIKYGVRLQFPATNNEAEYEAVLTGLRVAKAIGVKSLTLNSDSKLVTRQLNNEYETKDDRMKRYMALANQLISEFDDVKIIQVPREENFEAGEVGRLASSNTNKRRPDLPLKVQYLPSIEGPEISYVQSEESWMDPIIIYIKTVPRPTGPQSLISLVVRAGYFWPSMHKDATQIVQTCDKCQRFRNVQHVPAKHLTSITLPWPFSTWGIDIMGPLPRGTRQVKFLVVAIDYFTKWVEAEPLAVITEAKIQHFVWKNIANGQTEVTNRTLLKLIKTRLEGAKGAKGAWPDELPAVLWAYRTTARTPTGETPFRMTFGTEAVISMEIGISSIRKAWYDEQRNDESLKLALDCLPEVKDDAAQRMTLYQERMMKYYN
nr:uncharacterized protein LOC111987930 [Quercus suber]